ncbi:MAG: hypothetical protein IJM76_00430 [Lachnospiraceae bacterium]|nr:hypothetical protein [Lachnospiraceae bacterium]
MQDLSYIPVNREYHLDEYCFTISIYTFSNVYTIPEDACVIEHEGSLTAESTQLLWAGGQERVNGKFRLCARKTSAGIRIRIFAEMERSVDVIRRVKLSVLHLEKGEIVNSIDVARRNIGESGLLIHYPEAWRESATPLVVMKKTDGYYYFRSRDNLVRDKVFAFVPERDGRVTAELIHEEQAVCFSSRIEVPEWEIAVCGSVEEAYREHIQEITKSYGFVKWEERKDVPVWLKNVSLVAAIHGQHWTGHIFNDYAAMLKAAQRLSEKIDPSKVLLYLPGWEGRYYWQYGDYRPDVRMGGPEGFARLIDGAHALGMHVMPMFGMNVVATHLSDYRRWGEPSRVTSASGNRNEGSVDWDGSRHFDHASNVSVHPGAPQWKNRFCDQVRELVDDYGFDAVFLDIMARWRNDPNGDYYEGVKQMVERIHLDHPQLLISGEGWYDALTALTPLVQCGHTDGRMHYPDTAYPPMLDPYMRGFAHLSLGDPAFLSTGVHEQGRNPEWKTPLTKGILPTVTIVDGTLDAAPERVDEIIAQAEEYYGRFIGK